MINKMHKMQQRSKDSNVVGVNSSVARHLMVGQVRNLYFVLIVGLTWGHLKIAGCLDLSLGLLCPGPFLLGGI